MASVASWSCDFGCGFSDSNFEAVQAHEGSCGPQQGSSTQRAIDWLEDQHGIQRRCDRFNIAKRLKAGGGFAIIDEFLPPDVAEAALQLLQADDRHAEWKSMQYNDVVQEKDSVMHRFEFAEPDAVSGGEHVADAVSMLFPELLPVFTVAKYVKGSHIGSHDDKALVDVPDELTGGSVVHSRKFACIYYLTKQWTAALGGAFVDEQTDTSYVPVFNRCVVFEVPRMHRVTVLTTSRPRYSVFGWWLVPGELYEADHRVADHSVDTQPTLCASAGCTRPAEMACPSCLEHDVQTQFCDQACFQSSWRQHKRLHKSHETDSRLATKNKTTVARESSRKKAKHGSK